MRAVYLKTGWGRGRNWWKGATDSNRIETEEAKLGKVLNGTGRCKDWKQRKVSDLNGAEMKKKIWNQLNY